MTPHRIAPLLARPAPVLPHPANVQKYRTHDIYKEFIPPRSRFLGRGCDEALFSEKKRFFSEKGGGNSVKVGFGKDFYRKGNSMKRSRPFSEPLDSEN